MNKLNKAAQKLFRDLKGNINIPNLINYLKGLGYSTVFFNTPEGDQILQAYDLPQKPNKAFTYCGITRIVFINNDLPTQNKIYSLLHELGHILLDNLESDECYLRDSRTLENQAEAFAYAVLTYKRSYKPLYFAICLVLTSVISATAGYNLHSGTAPQPEQYNVPAKKNITQQSEPTEVPTPIISENNMELVYVTKSGTHYHKADCRYIKNNNTATSIKADEADKRYTPCKVCNPK